MQTKFCDVSWRDLLGFAPGSGWVDRRLGGGGGWMGGGGGEESVCV